ncbi:MAG: dTMP kinase [Eubacteriales bacterium]
MAGLFVTFEGPDGSGKTTQINLLKNHLELLGLDIVLTREPGGTVISEKIREILLDKKHVEMDYICEALLYAASRAQHVAELIIPSLDAGKIVVCDRFVDSSIVYQGIGRKLGDSVKLINDIAIRGCMPDATFLIKVDPKTGKSRRDIAEMDRLDLEEINYHSLVYDAYEKLQLENPKRITSFDGNETIEQINKKIIGKITEILIERKVI